MKLVKEHINEFEQGGNPYEIMGLGSFKVGDTVMCSKKLYYDNNHEEFTTEENYNDIRYRPGVIYTIRKNGSGPGGADFIVGEIGIDQKDLNKFFKRT
jgi:hypothetical protein